MNDVSHEVVEPDPKVVELFILECAQKVHRAISVADKDTEDFTVRLAPMDEDFVLLWPDQVAARVWKLLSDEDKAKLNLCSDEYPFTVGPGRRGRRGLIATLIFVKT